MANVDLRDFIQYVSGGFASLQDIMNLASDIGIDPQTAISVVQQVQPTMLPTNPFAGNYTTPTQEYSAPRIGFEEAVSIFDPVTDRPPPVIPRDPRSYDPGLPDDPPQSIDMFGRSMASDDPGQVNLSATKVADNGDGTYTRYYFDYNGERLGEKIVGPGMEGAAKLYTPDTGYSTFVDSATNSMYPGRHSGQRMHGDPMPSSPHHMAGPQTTYELDMPPHAEPKEPIRRLPPTPTTLSLTDTITDNISTATGGGLGGSPVVEKDNVNVTETVSPTTFDTGNMVVDMGDALSVANSPFTNQADRTAAQDYISGIVSNIRMPF
tara:strand:- start:23159 stop:24124 length:966 start_codon:yes stop_codon:yes gene_type:complete